MEQINLKASPREIIGKKVKVLRSKGQIPSILYGRDYKSTPLLLDKTEFEKVFSEAGSSMIVNLDITNKGTEKILIREPQKDPVTDLILHVDLYKVDMTKEIHTDIPLKFVGASAAVEELEGNLISNKDALEVECLPDRLVSEIEIDITPLKTFEDLIKVKNIKIPEGIKVINDPEEIIAQVTPPRSEEELEAMEQEAAVETEKAGIENIEATAEAEKAEKEVAKVGEEEVQSAKTPAEGEAPKPAKQPTKENEEKK